MIPVSRQIEDEFKEASLCDILYKEIYDTNRRLCNRLKVQEDNDIEIIINRLFDIGKHSAMRLYGFSDRLKREKREKIRCPNHVQKLVKKN